MVNSMLISAPEASLLKAIREVGFGELMFVEIQDAPKIHKVDVDLKTRKLLALIRDGNPNLDSIKIHQFDPVQVTVSGECEKLRYKKKIIL